jgi:polyhydroxybutyrate depolymerase
MINKVSFDKMPRSFYWLLAVVFILLGVVGFLVLHSSSLSGRISNLEKQADKTTQQLALYERTLCSNDAPITQANSLSKYTIESAGLQRTYQVHTPSNYDQSVRYPVIISFDGIEGSGNRMEAYSSLDTLPVITVYPDSLSGKRGFTSWQGAPYSAEGDRDVQFVSDILSALPSQYCTDTTRIFAVGMSNGGAFAMIAGCALGNQIKAVASVSGAYYSTCKQELRTPSLLVIHSTDDRQAPFNGVVARNLPQIPRYVDDQAAQRHCKTDAQKTLIESAIFYNWKKCDDNSLLRFVVLDNQAHGWLQVPQTSLQRTEGTAGYIWNFFEEAVYSN